MSSEEAVVLTSAKRNARFITLNRVRKLNSLNTEMVSLITPNLLKYAKEPNQCVIILNSNSPKALCAGGDVAEVANQIVKKNPNYGADFFDKEYNLDYIISTFPKPYISIMDNITFGGGVGLSVHAPFRIATERTKLAMPEMDIGFFPDVGTTFFLPRLDDKLGYYIALTSSVLKGEDAYFSGFATHYIKSEKIGQLTNRLADLQPAESGYFDQVNQILNEFQDELPKDYQYFLSTDEIKIIKDAFSKSTIDEVLEYFKTEGSEFSKKTLKTLLTKPRTSIAIGHELMNRGLKNTIKEQFELEMVAATNIMTIPAESNDFAKGVVHKLVDKIKDPFFPKWNDPSIVTSEFINKIVTKSETTKKYLPDVLIQKWFGVDYSQYPYNYGLPRNKEVSDFIAGTDGSNRTYLPTPNEVFKHFKGKSGIELKVKQLLDLHGETAKYDHKYVTWKD
ncbi:unnamed protein product [Candida verbasci]|uniref:3-hydroxyisobutyryl-CoA hydrolase n=1 Tax=Candida verbasci TaxID=1227364 RepID=A0A9W4XCT4_9ASCO|nr:unnamed protein product [Candida verbasci]